MKVDWKNILRVAAPTLATALGGPLAGFAVKALSQAILGTPDGAEADIAAAVASGNPDILLKLKEADQAFAVRMRELDIDVDKIDAGDRDSARKREATVGGYANPFLAGVIVASFMGMVAFVLIRGLKVPPDQAALIGTLIGYVSAKADQVVSYYFGSSSGSAHKNVMMERAINK